MAIEKRTGNDGKPAYRVRIAAYDPVTGHRRNITVGTYDRKKDAEAAQRDALAKRDRGSLLDPAKTTVGELLDEWLTTKTGTISANSHKDYEIVIRRHLKPAFGNIRVQTLKADRVQAQYGRWQDAGMSARMVRACGMRLSQALDYGVKVGIIYTNVVKQCEMPKLDRSKPDVWNADELRRFFSISDTDTLAPLWRLLAGEGLRRGEALALRWQDINWDRGTAHLSQTVIADKTDKGKTRIQNHTKTEAGARTVRLTDETLALLRSHRKQQAEIRLAAVDWEDNDLIVCTTKGTPIGPAGNVHRSFNAVVKRAGLRQIRVHDLRHSHATILLLAGVPAKIVSERLGHASVGITLDFYSHVLPDIQGEAAAAFSRIMAG